MMMILFTSCFLIHFWAEKKNEKPERRIIKNIVIASQSLGREARKKHANNVDEEKNVI
jgi:hypothetical protein